MVLVRKEDKLDGLLRKYYKAKNKGPSLKTMEKWIEDGVAKATDGCRVEPDGVCPHGYKSWLLVKGVI